MTLVGLDYLKHQETVNKRKQDADIASEQRKLEREKIASGEFIAAANRDLTRTENLLNREFQKSENAINRQQDWYKHVDKTKIDAYNVEHSRRNEYLKTGISAANALISIGKLLGSSPQ